jgi:hypothetical protein
MKKYTYTGAQSTLLNLADDQQMVLNTGKTYELPETHPHVVGLQAQGHLTEVADKKKEQVESSDLTNTDKTE